MVAKDKHWSLSGPFISYEENEVLRVQLQMSVLFPDEARPFSPSKNLWTKRFSLYPAINRAWLYFGEFVA